MRHCDVPAASRPVVGLARACHPLPSLAVAAVVALLAATAGRDGRGVALTFAAVLVGQLSVGWANDAVDASRDIAAGRTDKPVVAGLVDARTVRRAAVAALAVAVVMSYVAAGPVGGSAHVVALASAWAYDLGVKSTRWSFLPFAVSFGLLPAFVTYGLTPPAAPAPWVTAGAALLGVGAHLANAVPDLERDRADGSAGVVDGLGRGPAVGVALGCVLLAVLLVLPQLALPWPALVAVVLVGAGVIAVGLAGKGQALFRAVVVLAVLAVAGMLLAGTAVIA